MSKSEDPQPTPEPQVDRRLKVEPVLGVFRNGQRIKGELYGHGEDGWEARITGPSGIVFSQRCQMKMEALELVHEHFQRLEAEGWTLE